jgi:SAM-dependent methyltransferase
MPLYRPSPLPEPKDAALSRRAKPARSAARLRQGETLHVDGDFRRGQDVIAALVTSLDAPPVGAKQAVKQAYREAYRETAWRLLAPVAGGRVRLSGAPEIGFLAELYPELESFWLPFPEVSDLANAWKRYRTGVPMPVLGHSLHPFYGTYLPRRTLHLELFATWLSGWAGPRDHAVDVGTGSGVLALMLARAGFAHVRATDTNPNACESVRREIARRPEPPRITVQETDLLGDDATPVDLIVFNPPWTPGPVDNLLDQALHYNDDVFERFFTQADTCLTPEGRIVFVFSNMIRLGKSGVRHPLDAELTRGRFHLVDTLTRRVKPTPSGEKPARGVQEQVEVWELARA